MLGWATGLSSWTFTGAYRRGKDRTLLPMADAPMFGVGMLLCFISTGLCIRWLLRYIASHDFVPYTWYRIAFGIGVLATSFSGLVMWSVRNSNAARE